MTRRRPDGPSARREWTAEQILEWGSVRDEGGCLLWQRGRVRGGYGRTVFRGVEQYTHRMAWEAAHGRPIPAGMLVCHHCDVRHCVEPSHLFLGTIQDNVADMVAKRRHCFGERSRDAKLSAEEVAAIRASKLPIRKIGPMFGVNASYVGEIRRGEKRRFG